MDQTTMSVSAVDTEAGKATKKMSFARVVAIPPKDLLAKKSQPPNRKNTMASVSSGDTSTTEVVTSLNNLNIHSSNLGNPETSQFAPRPDDAGTHISLSSIQTPSIASGLALALDEKESIRPDDSASVQLADDDDSGPGSGAQNSRLGSEAGVKAFHSQLREISNQQAIPPVAEIQEQPVAPIALQYSYWMPDEKLLEALETSKDRLYLLGLEQQVIAFVQGPEDELDLPPSNSFLRLLAHRLAEYYRLTHIMDATTNCLRLCKTAGTQLPTPLSAFRPDASSEGLPATVAPSLRIMRRDGLGESGTNTNSNSMVPSKATSEGSEHGDGVVSPAESSSAKDKTQSREQREANYKAARDRIFANFKEGDEKDTSAGPSAEASRASSVTGNRKKKKKQQKDDDFEARSVYYRHQPFDASQGQGGYVIPYMVQPAIVQPTYNPVYQTQYQVMQPQQMVPVGMVQPAPGTIVYQPVPQQFASFGVPQQQMMGTYYSQVQQQPQMQMQYPQQYVQAPYPQMPAPSSRPESQMSEQSWSQGSIQGQYGYVNSQAQYPAQSPQPIPSPSNSMSIPYAYGQLPYQPHSPNNRNAHPLPGSYNRSASYNAQQSRSTSSPQAIQPQAQPMQYFTPQQQMPQGQYMPPAFGNQNPTSSRKHPPPHNLPTTTSSSTISKWGIPPTLPAKPPPPAPASSGNRILDGSIPVYQNGTYTKPSNPPHDARAH